MEYPTLPLKREEWIRQQPVWPLKAPGMAPVGQDFIDEANNRGDDVSSITGKGKGTKETHGPLVEEIIREALYGRGELRMNFTVKKGRAKSTKYAALPATKKPFNVISGHLWGWDPEGQSAGPMPSDVMIVGKNLGDEEITRKRLQRGKSGRFALQTLQRLGEPLSSVGKWYVTNLLKTEHLDGDRGTLKSGWIDCQRHLLDQEIRLVRPKYMLLMGADAVKAMLGKDMTLGKMEGRIMELEVPITETETHTILVMACTHPAAVLSTPELTDKFERDLNRFRVMTQGVRWDQSEQGLDHRVISDEKALLDTLLEADRDCDSEGLGKIIALDAEWNSEHPQNANAYLRTVQISWAHKKAATIVCHEQGGGLIGFKRYVRNEFGEIKYKRVRTKSGKVKYRPLMTRVGALQHLFTVLTEFFSDKRISGHLICADAEWLLPHGLDLRPHLECPEDFMRCKHEGPLDTALMAHSVNETDDFTLTGQTLRYTESPRYDVPLGKWKEQYCKQNDIKASDLEGYGDCPDDVLYPYANYDADVTRRLAITHIRNLDCDQFGNNCWEAYWLSIKALPAVLEIDTTGILLDRQRVDDLTKLYIDTKGRLALRIQEWTGWYDINLNSRHQVAEVLFGEKYNGHDRNPDGTYRRLRPDGVRIVGTLPLLSTDKRPKQWAEVMAAGKEDEHNASTNKQVLGMLVNEAKSLRVERDGKWLNEDCSDIIGWIRDYRFISQILKSVLRMPETDADNEEEYLEDEGGHLVYSKGIAGSACSDGRVRTFISQLKETGRWSSARPPLQNISKRREADYARILGDAYQFPLRSIFMADPEYVLLEADYTGAELYGMAIMSGDSLMIEHAKRNLLPEHDPDFYDMHSNVAVMAFGLDCEPSKGGLKKAGKKHLRIVAKSVIFGIAYGRGAKAIAIAAKEEGVEVTEMEAQQVIDTILGMYPGLVSFFEECRSRAVTQKNAEEPAPRWLCGPFGRFRRFPEPQDRKVAGDMERQAQNFPIQGMIADAVSLAISNIYEYRKANPWLDFRVVLQIHDAIILLVHKDHVPHVIDKMVPETMEKGVPIYRSSLDGTPDDDSPAYYLGADTEIATHWGVPMMPDECVEMGIDPKYGKWEPHPELEECLISPENFADKVWSNKHQKLFKDDKEFLAA